MQSKVIHPKRWFNNPYVVKFPITPAPTKLPHPPGFIPDFEKKRRPEINNIKK